MLSSDPLPSFQSFNPPAPHLSCQVPTNYGPTVTLSLAVSLTRVPLENDPTWARRWPGMKSSRLSPAGWLQGGACILGSRSEGCGCASSSSARPLWVRREEGEALLDQLDLRVGKRGRLWEGVRTSWVGAPGPRKQATPGTRLQAASASSQRHNGLLVRLGRSSGWEWGRGGWPGGGLRDKASGRPAGQPLWGSHYTSGAFPQREAEGTGAAGRGLGTQDFQFPLPPLGPVCASAHQQAQGFLRLGSGLVPQQGQPPIAQQGHGRARGGISRQQEPLPSSEEYPLPCLASLA